MQPKDWKKFAKTFVVSLIALWLLTTFVPVFTIAPQLVFLAIILISAVGAWISGFIAVPYLASFVGLALAFGIAGGFFLAIGISFAVDMLGVILAFVGLTVAVTVTDTIW